jgi:hypothetical protein
MLRRIRMLPFGLRRRTDLVHKIERRFKIGKP